jgi:hypothetical protein
MNRRIVFATVILLVVCSSGVSQAQGIFPGRQAAVYSVKFLCGFQDPVVSPQIGPQTEPPVKPGNYATAVNIHNFHAFQVNICKKAVLAPPERCFIDKPTIGRPANDPTCNRLIGPVIGPITLGPDDAFEVDCQDIVSLLHTLPPPPLGPTFIKGFVEISVTPRFGLPLTNPISVTGVYTSITCSNPFDQANCFSAKPSFFQGSGAGLEVEPQNSFIGEPTCKG